MTSESIPSSEKALLEEAVKRIEAARNEHWQEHLREHSLADGTSCPRDYGIHDALYKASSIVRDLIREQSSRPAGGEG